MRAGGATAYARGLPFFCPGVTKATTLDRPPTRN
jgi:hypothetical protein